MLTRHSGTLVVFCLLLHEILELIRPLCDQKIQPHVIHFQILLLLD